MKLATGAIGALLMALGFESILDAPWFGWLDIALGVLALLSAPSAGRRAVHLAPLGPVAVGAGAMLLCIAGALSGIVHGLLWGTLGLGLGALGLGAIPVLDERRSRFE